ncbi:glycosyltransferase family 4 protein [Candidatus Falkowbacteria bacterium]|nr:glycosyltransferase family 4 protein [Candidatus Falkowbacteria bacterium]
MKKTLIITWDFPQQVGGIATYVKQFADSMPNDKVVVYAWKLKGREKECKEFDAKSPYKVIRKKPLWPRLFWPRWSRLLWQIFWIVRKEKIEAIHIHQVLPVGYIGLAMKKLFKIPYLVFSHGTDIREATRTKWKTAMARKVVFGAEQIIVNSEFLKSRWLSALSELQNKITVVYPCPNDGFFVALSNEEIARLKSQLALDGKKVMLTVSRLTEGKGFPHLLRLMPELLKSVPNLVWLVIGDGPKKQELFETTRKNNLQNVVRFIGASSHDEVKKYFYTADLFVLLTHPDEGREEGMGLVFLEASACGLPSVAGKSGGVGEAVYDGQTGVIVDIYRGDKSVISAIVGLLKDPVKLKAMGEQAKLRAQYDFKWEAQLAKLKEWL